MGTLIPGSIQPSFALSHGPYMLFLGGLMQIIVGITQIPRNNLYGTIAFLGFGSIWFSNGLTSIMKTYFLMADEDETIYTPDPWGAFVRAVFVFGFSAALLKQTFVMSKLSTTLIALLCCKVLASAFAGWSTALAWVQFGFGWITSAFAFYVFLVEFTNGVYHKEIFNPFKWSKETSPDEVFGVYGRTGTLHTKAAQLRRASFPTISLVRQATASASPSAASSERAGAMQSNITFERNF